MFCVFTWGAQSDLVAGDKPERVVSVWRQVNDSLALVLLDVSSYVDPGVRCKGGVVLDDEVQDWGVVLLTWLPLNLGSSWNLVLIATHLYIVWCIRWS